MFNNGGDFRKWYGNLDLVVNWQDNGRDLKSFQGAIIPSEELYFLPAISWSRLTSGENAFRTHPQGVLPGDLSPCFYSTDQNEQLGYLNSSCASYFLSAVNPTITAPVGDVAKIPVPAVVESQAAEIRSNVAELISLHREDWNSLETAWDFSASPLLGYDGGLCKAWEAYERTVSRRFDFVRSLETRNNQIFIDAFGLQDSLSPDVPADQVTLIRAERQSDAQRFVSFAIGCMMGRYSLDAPGLVYSRAGNVAFDPTRYERRFPADGDGILPLTDERWFEDDAASRMREFMSAVWGDNKLNDDMRWLAESLGRKGGETDDETIRSYLAGKFFKDHLQAYKKRPIYWLFSSGKQGAFQVLVYLHRYNEGTLARMRAEYVVPLIAKMASRLDMLNDDVAAASAATTRTKLQKQIEALRKKQLELQAFDEKLRHYADMRITLDLDDGVKINYAKFGDLVAESKAVTGGSDE